MADPIAAGRRAPNARDLVLRQQLRRVLIFVLLGVLPAIWISGMIVSLLVNDLDTKGAYDLKVAFLPAAHAVLHGASPYPGLGDAALSHQAAYVYPPFVAFVVTPLTVFSVSAASVIGVIGSLLVIPVILALADVRDWRCYGVALCWSPVFNAVQNVNVSVPIALLVALAWRFRRAWLISGLSIGCAVAAKVFVWPLLIWPLAVARWRALVTGIVTAAALVLGSWAAIGFKGFGSYPNARSDADLLRGDGELLGLGRPARPRAARRSRPGVRTAPDGPAVRPLCLLRAPAGRTARACRGRLGGADEHTDPVAALPGAAPGRARRLPSAPVCGVVRAVAALARAVHRQRQRRSDASRTDRRSGHRHRLSCSGRAPLQPAAKAGDSGHFPFR